MKENRVAIFGGGGFMGSHLAERLMADHQVRIFEKKNFSDRNIRHIESKIDIIEGDFNNIKDIESACEDIDCVFHLIWSTLPETSNENCLYDIETNMISSIKFLDYLKTKQNVKLIFASSGGTVYGEMKKNINKEEETTDPLCSYGITKLMLEKYLYLYKHLYDLNYFIARISNPYGERQDWNTKQGLIVTLLNHLIKGRDIEIWGDGSVVRDYIYVKDVVDCLGRIVSYRGDKRICNISSGRGYSINEIIDIIFNITGKRAKVEYRKTREFDVKSNVLDNSLAFQELRWRPVTDIHKGILILYEWMKTVIDNEDVCISF